MVGGAGLRVGRNVPPHSGAVVGPPCTNGQGHLAVGEPPACHFTLVADHEPHNQPQILLL
jgi:hypothetical protein